MISKFSFLATWFVMAIAVLAGIPLLGSAIVSQPVDFALGLIVAVVIVVIVLAILRRSRLWPQAGQSWVWAALLWGALPAFVVSIFVGRAWHQLVDVMGVSIVRDSFAGAYPEELMKALGVVFVLFSFSRLTRPWHGFIVGIIVGLGFDLVENIFYGLDGARFDPNSNLDGLLSSWISRLLVGPGLHMIFTSFAGLGLAYAFFAAGKALSWRVSVASAGVLAALGGHFAWNLRINDSTLHVVLIAVLSILIYGAFFVLCRTMARRAFNEHRTVNREKTGPGEL